MRIAISPLFATNTLLIVLFIVYPLSFPAALTVSVVFLNHLPQHAFRVHYDSRIFFSLHFKMNLD